MKDTRRVTNRPLSRRALLRGGGATLLVTASAMPEAYLYPTPGPTKPEQYFID